MKLRRLENSRIYKELTKRWHDAKIRVKKVKEGNQMFLFNSKLRLFPRKLKNGWSGPFIMTQSYPHGAVKLCNTRGERFKVNGQRLMLYHGGTLEKFHQVTYLRDLTK